MIVNSPLVIAIAAVPVLFVLAVVYLVSKGGEVIDRGRADIDTPAEDDPAWEWHCHHALATVDERWNGIDEIQYRRLIREYRNHPTTN